MPPEPQQAQTEQAQAQASQLQQVLTDPQVQPSCPVQQWRSGRRQVLGRSRVQARRPRGSRRVPQSVAVVAEPEPGRASLL